MATQPTNFIVNLADLNKILEQIKIAENHVATGSLTNLDGTPIDPLLPAGLRTVDGTYNSLLPGNITLGAADQVMPRLLTPVFLNDMDGDSIALGPPGSGAPTITNTDYNTHTSVADADPRIISNLISDQSVGNFAALFRALELTGSTNPMADAQAIMDIFGIANDAAAAVVVAQTVVTTAGANLSTAQTNNTAAQDALAAALSDPNTTPIDLDIAIANADSAAAALAVALSAVDDAGTGMMQAQHLAVSTLADAEALPPSLGLDITNGSIMIENLSPDIGLSPPFNGWMTLFGQFFDHGLDLIRKGGNGTVYIPLQPDDPLYVVGGPNFMALTRASTVTTPGADGILGTADDQTHETVNTTTPWIDQNQTYTSNASHQVFLREYVMLDGKPVSTGHLLDGANGGIANWAEVKAQALSKLGIRLNDFDVGNVPQLITDEYGAFVRGPNGFVQLVIKHAGADNILGTADDVQVIVEGNPTTPVNTRGTIMIDGVPRAYRAVGVDHAFLDDIAHHAAPGFYDHDRNPATPKIQQTADVDVDLNGDGVISTAEAIADDGLASTYDNELLDRHYITGDGRGNENIGLTTVHGIFHSEHNRLVEDYKHTILASGDLAVINEWLLTDLTDASQIPTTEAGIAALVWDGERLFQAGRFVAEMQYQHLVFEEFARKVQPAVNPFVFSNSADLDPAITAEFAHVVYRFGHSMLTETVDRLDANNQIVDGDPNQVGAQQLGLIEAFLNPVLFDQDGAISASVAAGQIIRGMTRQVGQEIDEFITGALRNNLVGLPLDLGALNIARGRDTGVPSFNHARAQFFEMTGDARLTPYTSWTDFATHLKNPMSIINFIAAYGTHSSITNAITLEAKRDAAMLLVFGGAGAPADSADFVNSTGAWADTAGHVTGDATGLGAVDFWIGGLAEEKQEFGGMLGATFNFVFQSQMENLQNGDRFYYLSRTQGMNLLNQLEANSFAALVMRNSDLGEVGQGHLPGDLFSTPDYILEIVQAVQIGNDPTGLLGPLKPLFIRRDVDNDGDSDLLQFNGGQHVVLGGSEENDTLIGGLGIDTLWGDGGNDRLDGGYEADKVHGGNGDDIITNLGGDDFLFGEEGNDVISMGSGIVLGFGGRGNDFIVTGPVTQEVFGGEGDDFILGRAGNDILLGNEGNDWIEGGEGFDGIAGDNSELFFNSPIIGHDVLNGQGNDTDYDGESGDDIMVQGAGIQRSNGMFGFDWAIHKGDNVDANSDLGIGVFATQPVFTLRDRFDSVQGLSGWDKNDTLTGAAQLIGGAGGAAPGNPADESDLKSQNVSLINGYAELLGLTPAQVAAMPFNTSVIDVTTGAEVIIGGGGNDSIKGNLGNDYIDGDAWLNVRILVTPTASQTWSAFSVNSLNQISARMLSGEISPGQLTIVREILYNSNGTDTAIYNGNRADYTLLQNANGSVQVTHTNVLDDVLNDGSDTVRNIERVQFADGTFNIQDLINSHAPVINSNGGGATAAISVAENALGAFATVAATDGDAGTVITYSISGGADAALFSINATTGALSFIASPNFELPTDAGGNNVYDVIVSATDNGIPILSDTQALAVTVTNVNEAPVISSAAAVNVAENAVGIAATVIAADPEGIALTYTIIGGADAALFNIDVATGALSFIASPNFEAPTDAGANNVYNVTVGASDGTQTASQDLALTVTNVNEAATGSVNITSYTATNTSASLTATNTISDPDGMTAFVQFQWQQFVGGVWVNIAGATTATLANQSNTTVRVTSSYTDPFAANLVISPETAFVTGNNQTNAIVGGASTDFVLGLGGSDTLTGGAGSDTVDGGNGNDRILATLNDGNDTYIGGNGADTYDLSATAADATINLVLGTASSAETGSDTLNTIENILGSRGNDTIIMAADNIGNVINGGDGVDTVDYSAYSTDLTTTITAGASTVAGSGAPLDTIQAIENIIGGSGNDTLTGNAAANSLNGGIGNDTLTGARGADNLTGGAGADEFVINTRDESRAGAALRDVITDFVSGTDRINLAGIDARTGGGANAGNQAFTFNTTEGAVISGAGQLVYHYEGTGASAITVIQGNVNADLAPDFEVALLGHITFQATDIIL